MKRNEAKLKLYSLCSIRKLIVIFLSQEDAKKAAVEEKHEKMTSLEQFLEDKDFLLGEVRPVRG